MERNRVATHSTAPVPACCVEALYATAMLAVHASVQRVAQGRRALLARRAQPARCAAGGAPEPRTLTSYARVLVAGATGGTGSAVVARLVAEGVPVRALVRDLDSSAARGLPAGVEVVVGDVYDIPTLAPALAGCDAVVCCTGVRPALDPTGPFRVDYTGTVNLVAAAVRARVAHYTLVTTIGVEDILFPLNLAWGVAFWKKRGEEVLQRSGLPYTIIRPGGLRSEGAVAPVVLKRGGSYGLPPRAPPSGSILRAQVAELCVASLTVPAALDAVVEAVTDTNAPVLTSAALFEGAVRR